LPIANYSILTRNVFSIGNRKLPIGNLLGPELD
jgi:hypothetical protein